MAIDQLKLRRANLISKFEELRERLDSIEGEIDLVEEQIEKESTFPGIEAISDLVRSSILEKWPDIKIHQQCLDVAHNKVILVLSE